MAAKGGMMPRLDDAVRESIDSRLARHQAIRDSFKGRIWVSQSCRLCNWASNGRTLDDAVKANHRHQQRQHGAEMAALEESRVSAPELRASFHDHDCVMENCACKCGCTEGPFCILVLGPLCSVCLVRWGRGNDEHGEKGA